MLVVPPQVGTGDTFNVPVSVTNWGWLVASGTVLITVEATTDGVWHDADPANPVIGSATPIISLGKHITNDYMVPVTIPSLAALPAATYKLVAKIQTVTNMGEINTADNFVTASQKGGAVSMKVVAALPDLTAAVGKPNSSRTVFIPGDSFQIPVTITNAGIRTANASVGTPILVDVRQGTSSTYSATDALIKQLSITNPIAPGKSVTMMVTVTIPHTGIPANFFVNANADSGSTVTEISETNNTAASAQITAGIQFGVFGKSGSRSVTFFDTDGTKVTMSLSKAGTGAVTKDGTGYHVTITGSNQQSELRISTSKTATPGDDGRFTINSLTVGTPGSDTTPLKSISATTTDVTGNFEIAGSVQTLDLGNFTGTGTLSVGAASFVSKQPVTLRLNAGTMQNVSLTSAIPITNMTVVNWLNTNSTTETVTAPYIETLNVTGNTGAAIAGDFQAGITTAGPHGVHTNSPTLNSVTIAGSLSGSTWAVTGQIGNVNVKGSVTNSTIAGTSINRINIAGDVTGTHFTATLPVGSTAAINSITIVGTMATSDLRSVGNINSITIGALNNSLIFAGVKNTVTGRPTATTDFTTPIPSELPKINSIVFTGIAAHATDPVLVNSSIAAGLIKTATLPLRATPVVSAGTGLTIFGFATRVGPVTHYTGPGTAGLYVSGDQALIT